MTTLTTSFGGKCYWIGCWFFTFFLPAAREVEWTLDSNSNGYGRVWNKSRAMEALWFSLTWLVVSPIFIKRPEMWLLFSPLVFYLITWKKPKLLGEWLTKVIEEMIPASGIALIDSIQILFPVLDLQIFFLKISNSKLQGDSTPICLPYFFLRKRGGFVSLSGDGSAITFHPIHRRNPYPSNPFGEHIPSLIFSEIVYYPLALHMTTPTIYFPCNWVRRKK